jgi:hypothetical protein
LQDFERFQQKNEDVIDENEVMRDVLPMLYDPAHILHKENLLFTQLESITDYKTVVAKPDSYDGAALDSIDMQVQADLGPYLIPTRFQRAPVAPNFFTEVKGPGGSPNVVKRQITHDLSLGARSMHQLQSYGKSEPVFDNSAYALGVTYQAGTGTVQIYTTHRDPNGSWGLLGIPHNSSRSPFAYWQPTAVP